MFFFITMKIRKTHHNSLREQKNCLKFQVMNSNETGTVNTEKFAGSIENNYKHCFTPKFRRVHLLSEEFNKNS